MLLPILLLMACQPVRADLEPATAADEVAFLDHAAHDEDGAFEIIAQPAPWPGDAVITQAVTPLRIQIRNHGDVPAEIHLENIALVSDTGRIHHAVPAVAMEGAVHTMEPPRQVIEPGFEADRFTVAGRYRRANPRLRNYNGPFRHDVPYYRRYYNTWSTTEALPTPEMIQCALPEGVLEAGGQVAGWLYFEPVGDAEKVHLTAELFPTNEDPDSPLAQLHVPFRTTD